MKSLFATAAVLSLAVSSASAADLAARPYTKAPAYSAPIYNWTGFYVGGFVGGAFGAGDDASTPNFLGYFPNSTRKDAFFGGGQIGYNYQFAPHWVAGLEGDFGALSNNDRNFATVQPDVFLTSSADWFASIAGRLGYTWGAGLIYAKGGVAFRDGRGFTTNNNPGFFTSDRDSTGYTVGGGIEYMFAPSWSAKIEYMYYNFGNSALTFPPGAPSLVFVDDTHTVKAGINYHFN